MEPEDGGRPYEFDSGREDDSIQIGQFYWVKTDKVTADDYEYGESVDNGFGPEWLGCVMSIGTNYVEMSSPKFSSSYSHDRVHFDKCEERLRREMHPEAYIQARIDHYQSYVNILLGHIQEETRKLGFVPQTEGITHHSEGENALVVVSSQVDTSAYKKALITAKEETLPDLFKAVEKGHKKLAAWMTASMLPMQASIGPMKDSIKQIDDRIYTISIYAGLAEEATKILDGDPAKTDEPLRVMQRGLFMDEECLANYTTGGIDIQSIDKFDDWLKDPENYERMLPFPRCMVAFRVRRKDKEREDHGNMGTIMLNIQLKRADKTTFLYIRNGGQLWRINADIDFGPLIFPNKEEFDPSQPMYASMFANKIKGVIPKSAYDVMMEGIEAMKVKDDEWKATQPASEHWKSPFDGWKHDLTFNKYVPVDPSSVYYDDAMEFIGDQVKHYNRIAVIIQGLFDRSPVLHPHKRVMMWDPASFAASVQLVYDNQTLTYGEAPDFEAYMAELNASIDENSILTGQEDYWMRKEAIRENKRQDNDYRDRRTHSNYTRYKPYGDDGPGFVTKPTEWKPRARKAVFRWEAEAGWQAQNNTKPRVIEVPVDRLFNISAYTPGDYKRFLSDTRTRADYMKWAPMLLAAEDFHAGKLKIGNKSDQGTTWDY